MEVEVIRSAMGWINRGHRVVMGTVVRTWGSSSRPPGSLTIIRDDGQVAASLSGGCIEDDLIERVKCGALAPRLPQATTYGASAEEAQRFGQPCGGTVQIVLEPLSAQSLLCELLASIESHCLELATGLVSMRAARTATLCATTTRCSRPCTARACVCRSSAAGSSAATSPAWSS